MGTFGSQTNPVTGKMEWVIRDEDYDYIQEIARSTYGDMLHDTERNKLYEVGLKQAIDKVHALGLQAFVLDIGTGTGLLSMMAVRAGADKVVACEAFAAMADCAERVIEQNGMSQQINVLKKRSTEVTIEDMGGRANILVAEVFDTELIGEGAISTFEHASRCLLDPKVRYVIPSEADIFIQPVSCNFFMKWHKFLPVKYKATCRKTGVDACSKAKNAKMSSPLRNPLIHQTSLPSPPIHYHKDTILSTPPHISSCAGAASVHDVQLNQLHLSRFVPVGHPVKAFHFDFGEKKDKLHYQRSKRLTLPCNMSTKLDCIFMWWQIYMDDDEGGGGDDGGIGDGGEKKRVILSTAPHWAHPTPHDMQWRDHWMQAVYYPLNELEVQKDETFQVLCNHDEYSLWFNLQASPQLEAPLPDPQIPLIDVVIQEMDRIAPACNCMGHVVCSRTRIGMMNDVARNDAYIKALKKLIREDSVVFSHSDDSLLPLLAAKLGAKKVFTTQTRGISARFLQEYIAHNCLQDVVKVISKEVFDVTKEDLGGEKISLMIGEPYYSTALLPWDNLHFLYAKSSLLKHSVLQDGLPTLTTLPYSARIMALSVCFSDLHKVKGSNLGKCEGFNMAAFDALIDKACGQSDALIEPHPLWEYPSQTMTNNFELLFFDVASINVYEMQGMEKQGCVDFVGSGETNGVVLWIDYDLLEEDDDEEEDEDDVTMQFFRDIPNIKKKSNKTKVSTGPQSEPGGSITWDPFTRQAVYFFKNPKKVVAGKSKLNYQVSFNPKNGEFDFDFNVTY